MKWLKFNQDVVGEWDDVFIPKTEQEKQDILNRLKTEIEKIEEKE